MDLPGFARIETVPVKTVADSPTNEYAETLVTRIETVPTETVAERQTTAWIKICR